jgi:hypothetical protein
MEKRKKMEERKRGCVKQGRGAAGLGDRREKKEREKEGRGVGLLEFGWAVRARKKRKGRKKSRREEGRGA